MMVPIGGLVVVAPVLVLLTASFVCVGTIAARPVAKPDVAHREEEGAAFGASEESLSLVGPIAISFTCCQTLKSRWNGQRHVNSAPVTTLYLFFPSHMVWKYLDISTAVIISPLYTNTMDLK